MLRRVSLQVTAENKLQSAAKKHGVTLSKVDCKSFNATGMSLLFELRGEAQGIRAAIAAIRQTEGVRQAIEGEDSGDVVPLLVVLDRPVFCRALNDSAIICLECPLDSEVQPASWGFIARRASDLRQVLSSLERQGISTRIEDMAPLEPRPTLTGRQREIMVTAVSKGFFEFPRRISLTELSKLVGVKPSTLSEILRGAERRIMENAFAAPLDEY
jgi:predicted DNA binding protein